MPEPTCADCRHAQRGESGFLCLITGNWVGASRPACQDFSRLIYATEKPEDAE